MLPQEKTKQFLKSNDGILVLLVYIMFEFEVCEVFEAKGLTYVNDCFKHEHNEVIGHY